VRALSLRQASACENAIGRKCACRCGGAFHGANRVAPGSDRATFEQLEEYDPHKLPPERKRRRPSQPELEL